jgi:hypothetical protein
MDSGHNSNAQLGWLRHNDVDQHIRAEAEKQYKAIWRELEEEWLANGGGN